MVHIRRYLMNTYTEIMIASLLVLAFLILIVPTSNIGIKILNKIQTKTKEDLKKWRRRQKVLDAVEKNAEHKTPRYLP